MDEIQSIVGIKIPCMSHIPSDRTAIMKDTVVKYTPQAHPSRTILYSMLYPAGYDTIVYGKMQWYIIHILSRDRTASGLFSIGQLVASQLSRYWQSARILPDNQYGFRKGLGNTEALLHASHVLESALDHGHEAKILQIDVCAAFCAN